MSRLKTRRAPGAWADGGGIESVSQQAHLPAPGSVLGQAVVSTALKERPVS